MGSQSYIFVTIQRIEKWNTDATDSTDLHGFLVRLRF